MRGAKGHVKFMDDEMHGPVGSVPDNWRSLFEQEQEPPEQEQEDDEDDDRDEPDQSPSEKPPARERKSEPTQSKGRIHQILTTPIDQLLK